MLMTDRPKETVFAKLCYNGPFLGEIKNKGDRVHITGIGRPTIRNYAKGQALETEYLSDYSQELLIDQAKYFDILLDDIDAKQAAGEIMTTQMQEARRALTEAMEDYLAGMYEQGGDTITNAALNSGNAISTIAEGVVKLFENNVPGNEEITLVVTPAVSMKIMMADILFNTDNKEAMGGYLGRMKSFINCKVYVSNAVKKTLEAAHCMMFTKKAIALAEQIPASSIERFRPHGTFADAIKCLHLYGAKVIRPKELIRLDLTTAEETEI
jgi:hypothetical protein